jgi:hypothetical protein
LFADYLWDTLYQLDRSNRRANRLLMETVFAALLRSLGVTPRAQIVDAAGGRVELCQFRVRSVGSTELVVLLRDFEGIFDPVAPEIDAELRFPTEAHTYDLDNGVYLGFGARLKLRVNAYTFRVFARLPYHVQRINVQVAAGRARLGEAITVTATLSVDGGQPRNHCLRLDVLAGGDKPLRYLAREVMAEHGTSTFVIPSAFNDPPGVWTIVVTDVNTGTQDRVQVNLERDARPVPEPEPLQVDFVDD